MSDTYEKIADLEESREDYAVRSEISGKVMYVNIEPGDTPNTMMTAITIYNLETMNIAVNFDELDVDYVSEGTEVTITRTSSERNSYYKGVITYLSPEATSSSGVSTFASTIEIDSKGELSSGVSVTYAESLTMILRMLGYSDSDIGTVYPDDYIRFAKKLGLSEGVDCGESENITRGEAAVLLVNMLSADTKSGSPFYKKLASSSVAEALLLDVSCTSADGRLDCVKLYANGQAVWYRKSEDISSSFIGREGTALLDDDGKIMAFLPGDSSYDVLDGVLIANSKRAGSGSPLPYEVELYTEEGLVSYPRAGTVSRNLVGCAGTLVLDDEGVVVDFYPNGDDYDVDIGILLEITSSKSKFYMYGEILTMRLDDDCAVSDSDVGKEGYVLYSSYHRVLDFYPTENSATQTLTDYGILLNNGVKSDNGNTVAIDFYVNGKVSTYACEVFISKQRVGSYGALILDEEDTVIAYIYDSNANSGEKVVSAAADSLVTEDGSYSVKSNLTVVAEGEVTTWANVFDSLSADDTVYLYFTKLGRLDMIVVG